MTTHQLQNVRVRVELTEFVADPREPDCLRRALEFDADRVSFEDGHAVLWKQGTEEHRLPADLVDALEVRAGPAGEGPPAQRRRNHPNAFRPWTPQDEQRLLDLYETGSGVRELAAEFGRGPNAIRLRLERLGVEDLGPVATTFPGSGPARDAPVGLAGSSGPAGAAVEAGAAAGGDAPGADDSGSGGPGGAAPGGGDPGGD